MSAASSVSRLTVAEITPGVLLSATSTRREHPAHVIPLILRRHDAVLGSTVDMNNMRLYAM
jgi:hypothetical protein